MIIYDFEVFSHDWVFVATEPGVKNHTVIHNDNEALTAFLEPNPVMIGFNNKGYDRFILAAILNGFTPEEVKAVNDYIIGGGQGWQCPMIRFAPPVPPQVDLMDDCQQGLSLKAIEAHLGMDIRETTVPFDLDRALTAAELEGVVFYCKHDVDATERLYGLRKDYLDTKVNLGALRGIPAEKAMGMTNAKLTAAFLGAVPVKTADEREYQYPDNLRREYIPDKVFAFFDRLRDKSIPDDVVFTDKLDFCIGECICRIGYGGIHGAIPGYREKAVNGRVIRNRDVASYYPHLLTIDGYLSRAIADPKVYSDMLDERMAAKKAGDKVKANALKLVANTTYGATLNQYNDLYDPLKARSVCITGQLRLLELALHLVRDCKSLVVIQLNTDGIMVSLDTYDIPTYNAICDEWQSRTGYELEEDDIAEIIQKDVNGYIEIATDGKAKIKGGVLVRGISPAGAFNVNNNANIIAKAVVDYFVRGIPAEKTISECNDIFAYQLVAKASGKYTECYHIIREEKIPAQKCNRVYASRDPHNGTLYKIHKETGRAAKIGGLPENCVVDNDNHITIDAVDKTWYIDQAKKYIQDFQGGRKKMATKKETPDTVALPMVEENKKEPMNIYQKLFRARYEFLKKSVTKSGINLHAEFKYFELSDIVPVATEIFAEVGLMFVTSFPDGVAVGTLVDCDNPESTITVQFNSRQIAEPAKFRMNEVQGLGAEITYQRRYLYMLILDIVDADQIDGVSGGKPSEAKPVTVPQKPATPAERTEIKKELTAAEGQADAMQITALKNALKALREKDPGKEEFIQQIAVATKAFTDIKKSACEALILKVGEMLKEVNDDDLPF